MGMSGDYSGNYNDLPYQARIRIQNLVHEKDLATHLEKGWIVVTQLQSGSVVIEKQVTMAQVYEKGAVEIGRIAKKIAMET